MSIFSDADGQPTSTTATTNVTPQSQQQREQCNIELRSLLPSEMGYYWDTRAPNQAAQLEYADKFFQPTKYFPSLLWMTGTFLTTPRSSAQPEVAFLGRSNVGKSSLLNAIMGKEDMCYTSKKPGRTRTMNAFGIAQKGVSPQIVLLDMPGYGAGSRAEWGTEIIKYLLGRRQLRRTFVLIDSMHGLKDSDLKILALLRSYGVSHQVVLSKVDRILLSNSSNNRKKKKKKPATTSESKIAALRDMLHELKPIIQPTDRFQGPGALGEIITCSAETPVEPGKPLGISALRWAILTAAGFDGSAELPREAALSAVLRRKPKDQAESYSEKAEHS